MVARPFVIAAVLALALGSTACVRRIGDGCGQDTECSLQGDRRCDITQTGGYCTIAECDPNACPDNALCVEFEGEASRLTRRFCMEACSVNGDCRTGYVCVGASVDYGASCPPLSSSTAPSCQRVLDDPARRTRRNFCVQSPTAM